MDGVDDVVSIVVGELVHWGVDEVVSQGVGVRVTRGVDKNVLRLEQVSENQLTWLQLPNMRKNEASKKGMTKTNITARALNCHRK